MPSSGDGQVPLTIDLTGLQNLLQVLPLAGQEPVQAVARLVMETHEPTRLEVRINPVNTV